MANRRSPKLGKMRLFGGSFKARTEPRVGDLFVREGEDGGWRVCRKTRHGAYNVKRRWYRTKREAIDAMKRYSGYKGNPMPPMREYDPWTMFLFMKAGEKDVLTLPDGRNDLMHRKIIDEADLLDYDINYLHDADGRHIAVINLPTKPARLKAKRFMEIWETKWKDSPEDYEETDEDYIEMGFLLDYDKTQTLQSVGRIGKRRAEEEEQSELADAIAQVCRRKAYEDRAYDTNEKFSLNDLLAADKVEQQKGEELKKAQDEFCDAENRFQVIFEKLSSEDKKKAFELVGAAQRNPRPSYLGKPIQRVPTRNVEWWVRLSDPKMVDIYSDLTESYDDDLNAMNKREIDSSPEAELYSRLLKAHFEKHGAVFGNASWGDDLRKAHSKFMGMMREMDRDLRQQDIGSLISRNPSGLTKWFGEDWVDICHPPKGDHKKASLRAWKDCGRSEGEPRSYPKCRPLKKARKMSRSQMRSACNRKRRVESEDKRHGTGLAPNMVDTFINPSDVPDDVLDEALYRRAKEIVKGRVSKWPSAYASGQLVQQYKRMGGRYVNPSIRKDGAIVYAGSTPGAEYVAVPSQFRGYDIYFKRKDESLDDARLIATGIETVRDAKLQILDHMDED